MTTPPQAPDRSPPAYLSLGFRPFFLLGALFAAVMIALWVPWFLGFIEVPSTFPPVAWHSHELLFGFMIAVITGFLLTAVPNWTGRRAIAGWPLAGLVILWLVGRIAIAFSTHADALSIAALSAAFPIAIAAVVGREIILAGNWRNLKILIVLIGFAAADLLFHYEIWQFGRPRYAQLVAVALALLLVVIVAGRIIPTFTGNWLKQNRPGTPLPPAFNRVDLAAVVLSGAALICWAGISFLDTASWGRSLTAVLMLLAAGANFLRQARWQPHRTVAEPLLAILHVAFGFVGLGFLLGGLGALWNDFDFTTAGLHAWTTGAIGTMMIGVMTRVSRGHTGRPLTAPTSTVILYALSLLSAGARIAAALQPQATLTLLPLSALAWIGAFGGFVILYVRMLVSPRLPHTSTSKQQ